jgi:hypothetical protein
MSEFRRRVQTLIDNPLAEAPSVGAVKLRALAIRKHRTWLRLSTASAVVAVIVTLLVVALPFGTSTLPGRHRQEAAGPAKRITGNSWVAESLPARAPSKVVDAGGKTFLVGTTGDVAASIWLDTNGRFKQVYKGPPIVTSRTAFIENASRQPPSVNDLIATKDGFVAVGQDLDVATGNLEAAAWYSTDGTTWTRVRVVQPPETSLPVPSGVTIPPSAMNQLAVDGSRLVAVGGSYSAVTAPGGRDVVPSACYGQVWTSTNGTLWRLAPSAHVPCQSLVGIADGPSGLLAVSSPYGATASQIWHQRGSEWLPLPTTGSTLGTISAISASSRGYVAVGRTATQGAIWWSPNGRTWTQELGVASHGASAADTANFVDVTNGSYGWLAVGTRIEPGKYEPFYDLIAFISLNGRKWTEVTARGAQSFAVFAGASSIAATQTGFDITGSLDSGTGTASDPIRLAPTLWASG